MLLTLPSISQLSDIPHFLMGKLQTEHFRCAVDEILQKVTDYQPLAINETIAGSYTHQFHMAWLARGLIDYHPDSRKIFTYQRMLQDSQGDLSKIKHFKTELFYQLHETRNIIEQITKKPKTCRLFLLRAKTELPWHAHYSSDVIPSKYKTVIIQIPLINSDQCFYQVKDRFSQNITSEIYHPGEIWLFNSYHKHRVINDSTKDRVTLFIETDFNDIITS